jgi:two-component system, LytTR family, sensor histidine kinase AlgZ
MTTSVASPMIVRFFKLWTERQKQWLQTSQEKMSTELQLLKAQVHPRFLINTLNSIYNFSVQRSAKTPALILKLSSLLNYMLYDCRKEEVLLEKELEVMKNYMELEQERYGDKIEISVNMEGEIQDKYITPLLMLPFLENAFKHGTSGTLERPWMSVDIAVKDHVLHCKVINSKAEGMSLQHKGNGINNVKKRLEYLYPGTHELKLVEEEHFFVVSLSLHLKHNLATAKANVTNTHPETFNHEVALPAY